MKPEEPSHPSPPKEEEKEQAPQQTQAEPQTYKISTNDQQIGKKQTAATLSKLLTQCADNLEVDTKNFVIRNEEEDKKFMGAVDQFKAGNK